VLKTLFGVASIAGKFIFADVCSEEFGPLTYDEIMIGSVRITV